MKCTPLLKADQVWLEEFNTTHVVKVMFYFLSFILKVMITLVIVVFVLDWLELT